MPNIEGQPPGTQNTAFKVLDASIAPSAFARAGGSEPRASSPEGARRAAWQWGTALGRSVAAIGKSAYLGRNGRDFGVLSRSEPAALPRLRAHLFSRRGWALGRILVLAPAAPPAVKRGHHRDIGESEQRTASAKSAACCGLVTQAFGAVPAI
jgi:hypothetical protein